MGCRCGGVKYILWLIIIIIVIMVNACTSVTPFTPKATPTPESPITPVRLMWINSYAEDNPWALDIDRGMQAVLAREGYSETAGTLTWETAAMDAPQYVFISELYPLADTIMADIREFAPDVVIVSDDEAARAIIPRYPDTTLPFVFCGFSGDPKYSDLIGSNITGVLEALHPVQNLEIARAFVAKKGRYVILSDDTDASRLNALSVYQTLNAYELDVNPPTYEVTGEWELWKKTVLESNDYDFIMIVSANSVWDANNRYIGQAELMAWMRENSPIPVFSMSDTAVQYGAVAGLVPSGYDQGVMAMETALRIVHGTHPTSIRTGAPSKNTLVMNLAAASNWDLPIPVTFPLVAHVYRDYAELAQGGY